MDVIAKLKLADWQDLFYPLHMIFKLDSPVTTDYQSHNNYTVMNSV